MWMRSGMRILAGCTIYPLDITSFSRGLHIESKMHHVAVFHDVVFPFDTESAGVPRCCFRSVLDIVFIGDDLRFDKPFFEIGVDDACSLRGSPSVMDGPGPDLLF